jgi:hypothetical protein
VVKLVRHGPRGQATVVLPVGVGAMLEQECRTLTISTFPLGHHELIYIFIHIHIFPLYIVQRIRVIDEVLNDF